MAATGVMEEIRGLLSQGKSSGQIIALGHKPPTVYKVQRQMRKQGTATTPSAAPSPLFQGPMGIFRNSEEGTIVVWHPQPPIPCPGCGENVGHWEFCMECNKAVGADCPPDSPACYEGFTFGELMERVRVPANAS